MATQHRFCVRLRRRTGRQGKAYQRIRSAAQVRSYCYHDEVCAVKLWCAYGMRFQCSCDYACKNTYILLGKKAIIFRFGISFDVMHVAMHICMC